MDCLHTILLGSYKYFFSDLMGRVSTIQKKEIAAKIASFPKSGMSLALSPGIVHHHQSFVGKDFKALAEMAPFVLWSYLNEKEKRVWLSLSKVRYKIWIKHHDAYIKKKKQIFAATYCENFTKESVPSLQR